MAWFSCLTPKGLNVRPADKPVLVCVTWAHTIFCFAGKKKRIFWTYGLKVMDVWSLKEKSRHGGHVLEPTSKSWPLVQKVEGRKKKKFKKNGNSLTGAGVDPWLAGDRGSTPAPIGLFQIFLIVFIIKKRIFGSLGNGPGLLREWVYSTPIIWSLPYTWKC
jgi:hypothetical protein